MRLLQINKLFAWNKTVKNNHFFYKMFLNPAMIDMSLNASDHFSHLNYITNNTFFQTKHLTL